MSAMPMFRRVIPLALLVLFASVAVAAAEPAREVVPITVDGVRQNILLLAPASPPAAAVVMFPGGNGIIGIGNDGNILHPGNFLIRTRAQWLAQGFLFVAVDAAPERAGRRDDRVGPANLEAITAIVRTVRDRSTAPIWLLGTSAGAPAALAGAAALPAGSIKGVVISSPVSVRGGHDTVFDAPLNRVTVPVLIQVHRDDQCRFSPPANAPAIKVALISAPVVDVQEFSGGSWPRSAACEAFAQHGFVGIEKRVVDAAADWIRSH